jgi:surfeit locus 1 family protein
VDHPAIARTLGWGEGGHPSAGQSRVAPFYIDLEAPVLASGLPKPGPLTLKDNHMQYAICWFGLAGAVVIAFAVWWRAQRRPAS